MTMIRPEAWLPPPPTEEEAPDWADWLESSTILLTVHGSHAYGTATETSDIDLKGVAIPPMKYHMGFLHNFEQAEADRPYDMVVYGVQKFLRMASKCNPNIIEVLWTDPEHHWVCTPLGEKLIEARTQLLSREVKATFSGYAFDQLKRLKNHRRWLLNPPTAPPTRAECGLPERSLVSKNQLQAILAAVKKQLDRWDLKLDGLEPGERIAFRTAASQVLAEIGIHSDDHWIAAGRAIGLDDNYLEIMDLERKFFRLQKDWKQYQGWKQKRNPARAALEAKMGYDGKHASHLVRLMRMCREILETGVVKVKRDDAEELLAIRNGLWSYDQLIEWAKRQDQELYAVMKSSPLPVGVDKESLEELCRTLVQEHLKLSVGQNV